MKREFKIIDLDQSQAEGYFEANSKHVVVEFYIPGEEMPLVITGERGKPVSNRQVKKYLNFLKEDQRFTNRTPTDFGYQDFLFENFDSRKGEYRLGFMRFVPDGAADRVRLRITECSNKLAAVNHSKYLRDTKFTTVRTVRRSIPVAKNTVKSLRMVAPTESMTLKPGFSRNIALKAM